MRTDASTSDRCFPIALLGFNQNPSLETKMIYTRIETIMANGNKSWMEIATEGLYEMVCPSGKKIVVPDKICNIIICDAFLVLRTEDRDFRNGRSYASFVKDNREVNNIDAFDWQGNHLWNIGEIVGDVKMAFDDFSPHTRDFNRELGERDCISKIRMV